VRKRERRSLQPNCAGNSESGVSNILKILAHAQIEPSPEYKNDKPFRKVIERLAFLANQRISKEGWEIEPHELRT
jgi:hypothetical protein